MMNYPDIKVCEAISNEFQDSEFVYGVIAWQPLNPVVMKRSSGKGGSIAPAPTCEELGEWLKKTCADKYPQEKGRTHETFLAEEFQNKVERLIRSCWGGSKNETQARAEAVQLILEVR